jgi:effector-binding domain-containing protein
MDYECVVREVSPQPIVSIRGTTTPDRISATIEEYLGEVFKYVGENGGQFAGPPFTRYHQVVGEDVDLEVGVPVSSALPGSGRVKAGELPGGEVVSTVHVGSYESLPAAGEALSTWAKDNQREAAGANLVVYLTNTMEVQNPAEWKTEVITPLKPASD